MKKTRYELGVMDLYPIVCNKTEIENNPYLQVELKEDVDPKRLHKAVSDALECFPLFRCTMKYDKKYFLEENDESFELINKAPQDRPLEFGDTTKGFLWQMCYFNKTICFEWCHAITDGKGGREFFSAVMCNYFGVSSQKPQEFPLELGLESVYDEEEKGIPQKKQPSGFKAADLPHISRGYKTDCHILRVPMSQVLCVAKKNDASPASVLPPLFSMALRKHISPSAKNRNVTCNMPIDCRGIVNKPTMHNFIVSKVITYTDKYDGLEFSLVSTIYRALIDLAVQPENIVKEATDKVKLLKPITSVRPKFLLKLLAKVIAKAMKHSDSNFTFTYLGRLNFPQQVMDGIQDFQFRSWTDFGECNIAAVDVGGTLVLNVCENYQNKNIIPDFIEICKENGINLEETELVAFEQANLRMKAL